MHAAPSMGTDGAARSAITWPDRPVDAPPCEVIEPICPTTMGVRAQTEPNTCALHHSDGHGGIHAPLLWSPNPLLISTGEQPNAHSGARVKGNHVAIHDSMGSLLR